MTPDITRAVQVLKSGGLVAFPTETVYGLGADASSAAAVARLYRVKGRPADHPVIVHFDSQENAFAFGREISEQAKALARHFWPGPLTLIVKRSGKAKDFVTGGQDTVGLRVPSHPVAQQLLKAFGGGIAAPSANRFGRVSPTTAAHVHADLDADVDLVLDGGPSEVGIESTIVDVSGADAVLLRPGTISRAEMEKIIPVKDKGVSSIRHSGGLEQHYAPRTPAKLVPTHALDREISSSGKTIAVLAFSRPDERVDFWIRMPREPQGYAQRLYGALRELDGAGCERILVEAPPAEPAWAAVNDRLSRACAGA